jgi:membrane protease YdiL (CAAX protease family)
MNVRQLLNNRSKHDSERRDAMQTSFAIWDHLLVLALASAVLLWCWRFPRLVRADAAGTPGGRLRYYLVEIGPLWALAAGVVALWIATRRPWGALLLGGSAPWRLALGWALAGAYVWLTFSQRRKVLARPERLARLISALDSVRPLLPRTRGERSGFAALSITAGICEELLFRGFLLWYATVWTGPVGGFLISSMLFGIMHVYLGVEQVPRTAFAGICFYVIAMTAGSLLPAMVCHAITDLVSGDLGYRALATDAAGTGAGR